MLAAQRRGLRGLALAVDERAGQAPADRQTAAANAQDALAADVDTWAQLDLMALFGRPELYRAPDTPADRTSRLREAVTHAPPLLVFVPLGITWFGLSRATGAYEELRSTQAGRELADGRTFLDLWQDGFGGHLSGLFTFGAMVWWTIAALLLLLGTTLAAELVRRRGDLAGKASLGAAVAQLPPLLTEAQLLLSAARLEAPARFVAELSRAAAQLTPLLDRAADTHAATRSLADSTVELLRTAKRSTKQLSEASAVLDGTAGRLTDSGNRLVTATERSTAAADAVAQLVREEVARTRADLSQAAAESVQEIREATDASARTVGALGDHAVRTVQELSGEMTRTVTVLSDTASLRMGEIGENVEKLVTRAAAQGERLVGGASERADASLAVLLDELRTVSAALDRSGDRLGLAGEGLSGWLEHTLGTGADHIARTYHLAIATAAVELSRQFQQAGGAVEAALTDFTRAVGTLDTAVGTLGGTVGSLDGTVGTLGGTVGTLGGTVGALDGSVGELGGAVGTLGGTVGSLNGTVTVLDGTAGALGSTVGVFDSGVENLGSAVVTLDGTAERLGATVGTLHGSVDALDASVGGLDRTVVRLGSGDRSGGGGAGPEAVRLGKADARPPYDVPARAVPPQGRDPRVVPPPQDPRPHTDPPQDTPPQDTPPQDTPPQDTSPPTARPDDRPPRDVPPAGPRSAEPGSPS
ncbi:hypothetical protein ACFVFS_28300 [Kitasatospora sp. NPDC057692]|uniref:hypothetical protein n=1 Tax=Kitasatospora sp. NPDC057692 TaxID=3346215 RepID=UPI0036BC2271